MREKLIKLLENMNGIDHMDAREAGVDWYDVADYLLDNGVIVLPCKVGDTVYAIEGNNICENKTTEIFFNTDGRYIFGKDVVGKSVFLTKEEAEAKQAELKGTEE